MRVRLLLSLAFVLPACAPRSMGFTDLPPDMNVVRLPGVPHRVHGGTVILVGADGKARGEAVRRDRGPRALLPDARAPARTVADLARGTHQLLLLNEEGLASITVGPRVESPNCDTLSLVLGQEGVSWPRAGWTIPLRDGEVPVVELARRLDDDRPILPRCETATIGVSSPRATWLDLVRVMAAARAVGIQAFSFG